MVKVLATYGNRKESSVVDEKNPFGYAGEYLDEDTGFIYLRNRFYSPEIGRFISEDPIRDGLNWYAYAGNNPVNRIDPSGLADVIASYIADKNGAILETISKLYRSDLFGASYKVDKVKFTIGDKVVTYDAKVIAEQVIFDSYQFGIDFGIKNQTMLIHQAGDSFYTVNDAALAWGLFYNSISVQNNIEYVSVIFGGNKSYTYTNPLGGNSNSATVPSAPVGQTLSAIIHAHAAYDPRYDNENFSPADKNAAIGFSVPIYVSTPGGYLKKYNPSAWFKTATMGKGLPRDSASPIK